MRIITHLTAQLNNVLPLRVDRDVRVKSRLSRVDHLAGLHEGGLESGFGSILGFGAGVAVGIGDLVVNGQGGEGGLD